ncbi:MAG: hypothetical protein K0R48_1079 [Gammaproteobacteria bacterium]|jgi:hypothetical protein|nr:hypothetical protein [Gammaproteobacteria bacterium]
MNNYTCFELCYNFKNRFNFNLWIIKMELILIPLGYGLIKFIAYTAWCYLALCWFDNTVKNKRSMAVWLGFIRLFLGFILGSSLGRIGFSLTGFNSISGAYFMMYPAIRAFEWGIMWLILHSRKINIKAPSITAVVLWIIGGIIVSCLVDGFLYLSLLWLKHFSGLMF